MFDLVRTLEGTLRRVVILRIQKLSDESLDLGESAEAREGLGIYHTVEVVLHAEKSSYRIVPCR